MNRLRTLGQGLKIVPLILRKGEPDSSSKIFVALDCNPRARGPDLVPKATKSRTGIGALIGAILGAE